MVILLLAAAAAQPSPEALRLGEVLANNGTLATLLPIMQQKEIAELEANHPELSQPERVSLRATARRVFRDDLTMLIKSEAVAFASQLSIGDMRAIAEFETSAAGRRYRAATPAVVGIVMQSVSKIDYKKDVAAAFCAQTGKLCAK